jgi:hypothetical protein
MKMWKGNGTTLLFSLQGLEILDQERRKMNAIVMEHFNKSGAANKQQPINQSINHFP